MNSLADRLDTLAREAAGSVEALPPELALRSRRRHRLKVATRVESQWVVYELSGSDGLAST